MLDFACIILISFALLPDVKQIDIIAIVVFFSVGYPLLPALFLLHSISIFIFAMWACIDHFDWILCASVKWYVIFSLCLSLFFFSMSDGFFPVPVFILICVVQSCIISAIKNFNLYLFLYLIYKITIFISVILLLLALVHSGNLLCAYEWLWVCSLRLFFVCPELTCTNEKKTTDAPKTKWINNCKSEKHQR